MSRGGFSTRDYIVDQSVNLMDIGDQGGIGGGAGGGTTRLSGAGGGAAAAIGDVSSNNSSIFSSINISGLFRANTGVEDPQFLDAYGDAAPSADPEEYNDSDKRRRVSPLWAALRSRRCMTLVVALIGLSLVIVTIIGTVTNSKGGDENENDIGDNENENDIGDSNNNNTVVEVVGVVGDNDSSSSSSINCASLR